MTAFDALTRRSRAARVRLTARQAGRIESLMLEVADRLEARKDTDRLMAEVVDLAYAVVVAMPGRTHPARGAMGAETERSHHCTACRCAAAGIDEDGAEVRDTIGTRQCSLFDPPDTRIDPSAAAGIRSGRILCPSCARGVPLEPLDTPAAVALELADGEAEAKDDGPLTPGEAWERCPELCEQIARMGAAEADAADRAFRASPEFRRTVEAAKRRRNKNWRGDANADAWDRARAAGRR